MNYMDFIDEDICYCLADCPHVDCRRNLKNRRTKSPEEFVCTSADLIASNECPHYTTRFGLIKKLNVEHMAQFLEHIAGFVKDYGDFPWEESALEWLTEVSETSEDS